MTQTNLTVLVVEDDVSIRNFILYTLKNEGFQTLMSGTATQALSLLMAEPIDLILLDMGLPDLDGMDVITRVRTMSETPIIVVSARDQDKEKAAALDAGADDYLTKPFSTTELMARIRVALRHLKRQSSQAAPAAYRVGDLSMDPEKHLVYLKDQEIHTTAMEYDLLALLFQNIGKVMTTKTILKEVWGPGYGNDTQVLRALMAGLRRKIEANPGKPRYILTEIGVGYRLVDE